ncbi:LeuA family protein [uncultured Streptococcus sp.]|uniref:LeuA family protein n=1 Tax=uncultured Streptococcus sp. TaxID=83427 RepID=UPI001A5CEBE0|nr:LeuA family protein [uncultured Streptococcus sp.]VTY20876.1 2-isopropylmalate synthase [uncultured Streptococcus sp.]
MIYIQDNTIRGGMQQTSIKKDVATKKKVITEISKSKIHSVEIGMCDTIQDLNILKGYMRILRKDQSGVVLTRLIESSIDLAFQLYSMFPNTVIKLLVPVSKMHITEKLKTREDIYLKRLERILDYSKEKSLHVDMVLEDSTRANREFLFQVLDIVSNYEVGFVTLADTVGCSTPDEYGKMFSDIHSRFPALKLSAHCHNDLGLATANTVAAIMNHASQIETTFLGIGERAGNTSLDEVIAILQKKKFDEIDFDLQTVYQLSIKISDILEYDVAPTKPIIGKNVFVHESGIHQDGTMKNIEMYQYLLPNELGIPNSTNYTISGISSKKVLYRYFESLVGGDVNIDELIGFYRKLSKITDKLSPEDCLELFKLERG